jgi:hypothetical protein
MKTLFGHFPFRRQRNCAPSSGSDLTLAAPWLIILRGRDECNGLSVSLSLSISIPPPLPSHLSDIQICGECRCCATPQIGVASGFYKYVQDGHDNSNVSMSRPNLS